PFVEWEKQVSINERIGEDMKVIKSSSPYAFFWQDEIYLFWMNRSYQYMYTKANRYKMEFEPLRRFTEWIGESSGIVPTTKSVPSFMIIDHSRYMVFYTYSDTLYYAEVE
ncbi:MAG: hypothetical protein LUE10_05175, partial [Alistipes sp.]|nr:hypothetical protein [Alistipes sp.]